MGLYAAFVHHFRESEAAEKLYRDALALSPKHLGNTGNLAAFLLEMGRENEASTMLETALSLNGWSLTQQCAETLLYTAVCEIITMKDSSMTLGRLKNLLDRGFKRMHWTFGRLFERVGSKLPAEKKILCEAIAAAILDSDKVSELQAVDNWSAIARVELPLATM